MSAFLDLFRGEQTGWKDGRAVWHTLAPLRYRSDLLQATVIIPAEFVTDLASTPRWPVLWLATGGRGTRSAVVHDFAYVFTFYWLLEDAGTWTRCPVQKTVVDEVFHESLLADPISGANRVRAWEMYVGVRLGGRGGWANETRKTTLNPSWSAGRWEAP